MEKLLRDSLLTANPDTAHSRKAQRSESNNYGSTQDAGARIDTDSDISLYDTDTDIYADTSTDTATDTDSPTSRPPNTSASTNKDHRKWKDEDQNATQTDAPDDKFKPVAPPLSNAASDSDSGLQSFPIEEVDDDELLSPNRVDQLVASFWAKVDKKIESAISSRQTRKQGATFPAEETGSSGAHSSATKEERKEEDENKNVSRAGAGICLLFVYIFQSLGRIFSLCTEKVKDKSKRCFTAGSKSYWRQDLKVFFTHRYTHLIIVMLTVFDFVLVIANILVDFNATDGRGMEDLFSGFLHVNVAILCLFVVEALTKMIVFRRDLFLDVMETFDTILVAFYFLAETIASGGFRNISAPYAKYLHVAVVLRLWRVCFLIEELQRIREEEFRDIER